MSKQDEYIIIHFIRPGTGERISYPPMTHNEARQVWDAMPHALRESAVIEARESLLGGEQA